MADYQLSYTGDQVNTAIGQIINKNITGTLTIETLDLTNSLAITQGGTGATTAADARGNLGIKSCGMYDILPIAQGGTGKTTAVEALKALGGASIKRVYSNASPDSAFPAQTVSNNMGGYPKYFVLFGYGSYPCALAIVEKNKKTLCYGIVSAAAQRTITINENNFVVSIGEMISGEWQMNNNVMVPLEIYGMEGVL